MVVVPTCGSETFPALFFIISSDILGPLNFHVILMSQFRIYTHKHMAVPALALTLKSHWRKQLNTVGSLVLSIHEHGTSIYLSL